MVGQYNEKYFEKEKTHWWFKGREKILAKLVRPAFKDDGHTVLLDIGVSSGFRSKGLCDLDRVIGIDNNRDALLWARRNGLRRLILADAEALPIKAESVGRVFCFDVLSHVKNDQAGLFDMFKICSKGGTLFVSVPAYLWLWSPYDMLVGHHRRYTKSELRRKLEYSGFEVVYATYFNTLLSPALIFFRLFKKFLFAHKRIEQSDLEHFHSSLLNRILTAIFSSERYLLRPLSFPFGISIFCAAQK